MDVKKFSSQNYLKQVSSLLLIALIAWSCSSSKEDKADGEEGEDASEISEAGTDDVPADPLDDLNSNGDDALLADETKKEEPSVENSPPPVDETASTSTDSSSASDDTASGSITPPTETASVPPVEPVTASADTPTASGEMTDYSVKRGDTLMKIAYETYGDLYSWRKIYEANKDKITDPNHVPPGVVLKMERPAQPFSPEGHGEKYEIVKGDTLGKISGKVYGTPTRWKEIWENNKNLIKNPNKIYAGFFLYYTPENGTSPQNLGGVQQPSEQTGFDEGASTNTTTENAGATANNGVPAATGGPEAQRAPASAPATENPPQ